MGHGWAALPHHPERDWLYAFVYLWHMPAFVLVTGYLSRSFSFTSERLTRLLSSVVVPYVLFEGALAGFRVLVGGAVPHDLWLKPYWLMWYLSSLFVWRLSTPLLRRIPHALAWSVAVSVLAGLVEGQVLDVERTMSLLPFFVLGLEATPSRLAALREPVVRAAAAATLLAAFALTGVVHDRINMRWLYWDDSYDRLGSSFVAGGVTRLLVLLVAGVLALSFLAVVPRRRTVVTAMGSASLVVYLFHGFVVKATVHAGLPSWAHIHPRQALAAVTVGALVVSAVVASPAVAGRLRWGVDPIGTWARWRAPYPVADGA
jgi:fucose 4-O-acetylase-like acetyltransferase